MLFKRLISNTSTKMSPFIGEITLIDITNSLPGVFTYVYIIGHICKSHVS